MKNVRWVILTIILLSGFVSYLLRYNLSIVGESMMRDLNINTVQLGMVFSAFLAGYTIFQFPGGIFSQRVGARRAVIMIAVAWGVLTIITALIPGTNVLSVAAIIGAFIVTRFFVGIVHAPIYPATTGAVAVWCPSRQWGLFNGLSSSSATLGAAAAAPLLVWFMNAYGWRTAILVTAPAGFLIAFLFHRFVTDDPRDHPKMTDDELAVIQSDRPPASDAPEKHAWKLALRDRNILLIAFSYFCMNYVFYLYFSWFFIYLVTEKGFSTTDAGIFTSAQWIVGAIGGLAGGLLCDALKRRFGLRYGLRWQAMSALFMTAGFLYAGAMSDDPVVSIVLLCIAFGCTQIAEAPMWVGTMAIAGPNTTVATGVLNTGGNIPGILGGIMVPLTAGLFGWPAAMGIGSMFAIAGGLLWIFIRADEPMDEPATD